MSRNIYPLNAVVGLSVLWTFMPFAPIFLIPASFILALMFPVVQEISDD